MKFVLVNVTFSYRLYFSGWYKRPVLVCTACDRIEGMALRRQGPVRYDISQITWSNEVWNWWFLLRIFIRNPSQGWRYFVYCHSRWSHTKCLWYVTKSYPSLVSTFILGEMDKFIDYSLDDGIETIYELLHAENSDNVRQFLKEVNTTRNNNNYLNHRIKFRKDTDIFGRLKTNSR